MKRPEGNIAAAGHSRQAFTLLELLLVISLLGLLAVFAWPNFQSASRSAQLHESARRMKALIAMCRAEAMNDSRRYRIAIRPDGSLKVRRQLDPIESPHEYVRVRRDWVHAAFLLDEVWVESIVPLPTGPPPILAEDDELIAFEEADFDLELDLEPIPVEELEEPLVIEFAPDGTSDSLRWILRDGLGRGLQMELDGRLGRVTMVTVERLPEDLLERPPEWEDEEEQELAEEEERYAERRGGKR